MGCGRSRDVEAARDAPSEPPPLPDLAPMAELEALLAEAVRLGMLDRRGGAETRQRVVDGELALDAVRNTWREILGFDDAPLTGDEVEVSIRREHPVFEGARPRSGSLVASAHDDLTSASDDENAPLSTAFPQISAFLDEARRAREIAYVHCGAGVSRACTSVAAYLIWSGSLSAGEALRIVQNRRPQCRPNAGFKKQLGAWAERCRGGKKPAICTAPSQGRRRGTVVTVVRCDMSE